MCGRLWNGENEHFNGLPKQGMCLDTSCSQYAIDGLQQHEELQKYANDSMRMGRLLAGSSKKDDNERRNGKQNSKKLFRNVGYEP